MQSRIVWMVDKQPESSSTQIQAVLQTQGVMVSAWSIRHHLNEMKCYGRRPGRTLLLTQRHNKARLQFARTYLSKPQSFWENVLECFLAKHVILLLTEKGMRPTKKRQQYLQSNMVEVQRCFGAVLLPLALGALIVYTESWNLETIKRFSPVM